MGTQQEAQGPELTNRAAIRLVAGSPARDHLRTTSLAWSPREEFGVRVSRQGVHNDSSSARLAGRQQGLQSGEGGHGGLLGQPASPVPAQG